MARFKSGNLELTSSNKIKHGTKTILDRDRKAFLSAIKLDTGTDINEFSTDGTLVGNSDSAVPTEKAVKAYVDAAGGGISYEIISGNTTAEEAKGYLINASNNDVTLTLPLSPSEGDTVAAVDLYNMATTNVITIGRNGENIEGESQDLVIDITMVFSDSTRGWTIVSEIGTGNTNYRYVDRGDPASPDWEVGDLTTDGTWRDLDCSSIVSSDAIAIIFKIKIYDDAVGNTFLLRKNGNTNSINAPSVRTQVIDNYNDAVFIVACDSNQTVQYCASNTTWSLIEISIMGWFTAGGSAGGDVCADNDMTDNHLVRADGGAKKIQESTVSNNWTEIFDQGNNFDGDGTFTAPITGKYLITGAIRLLGITAGHGELITHLFTSNRNYNVFNVKAANVEIDGSIAFTFAVLADLDANDTAFLRIIVYNDTKVVDITDTTTFAGALIC